MPKYRKKPVVIEARQWDPSDMEKAGDVIGWLMASDADHRIVEGLGDSCVLEVTTIHGEKALVRPGDWVAAEPQPGRYYPIKPDIFDATYEAVEVQV